MEFNPNFKGHYMVIGITGMGKGVFTAAMARLYMAIGIPVFLLTCKEDELYTFPADFRTQDEEYFLESVMNFRGSVVRNGKSHAVGAMAVIDEAWNWEWKKNGLQAIANAGRSRGIEMWVQSPRFCQIPKNVRGNCDNVVAFRQKELEDIEALSKKFGPEFSAAGNLNPGQYLSINQDTFSRGTAWTKENGVFRSI